MSTLSPAAMTLFGAALSSGPFGTEGAAVWTALQIIAPAAQRLSLSAQGDIRYALKTPYRDGTPHVVFEPLDFLSRLATHSVKQFSPRNFALHLSSGSTYQLPAGKVSTSTTWLLTLCWQ